MKIFGLVLTMTLVLTACGPNESAKALQKTSHSFAPSANSWVFTCDEGELIVSQNNEQAAIFVQDQLYLMRQVPSASGVKLVSLDEKAGLRWYGKGQEGFLRFMAADHTAKEQEVYTNCETGQEF